MAEGATRARARASRSRCAPLLRVLICAAAALLGWPVPCSTPPGLYHFAYELVIAPEGPPGGINFVSNYVEILVNP